MANTGFRGIDVRQTDNNLMFRAFLLDELGQEVTSGTASLYLYELQSDGTLKSYDFDDDLFKTTALTTETASMTHQTGNNGTTDTGIWTHWLSTGASFTRGAIYLAKVTHLDTVTECREFQFGNGQGDMAVDSDGNVSLDDAQTFSTTGAVGSVTDDVGITQAAADKVWSSTTRTLSAFAFAVDISSTGLAAIWNRLTSAITAAGSIGKLIVDNLNASITSRAPSSTALSTATWTNTRAALLDHLDADISSRLADGNVTVGDYASGKSPADLILVTPAQKVVTDASGYVTSSIVAGNVTGSVASVTGSVASVTGAVGSVTGNVGGSVASVTADVGITQTGADKVWSSTTRTLSAFGFSVNLSSTAVTAIWDAAISGISAAGSIGKMLVDKLSGISGQVASQAEVLSISNTTRVRVVAPSVIERPDSSTEDMLLELYLYDGAGGMQAPDDLPTLSARNQAGTDRSANLGTVTLVATGHYQCTYTVSSTDDLEQLAFEWSVTIDSSTSLHAGTAQVVDTTAVDFTSSDRATLNAIMANADSKVSDCLQATDYTVPPTASTVSTQVAADLLAAHGSGNWTTATGFATATDLTALQADVTTIKGMTDATISSRAPSSTAVSKDTWTDTRASLLDHLDADISDTATAANLTALQADVTAMQSDITTIDGTADAIKLKTDLIPADPATETTLATLATADDLSALQSSVDTLPAASDVATAILVTPDNKLATDSSGNVTAATVSDKTGYSLSTAGVTAVQSGLATSAALATVDTVVDGLATTLGTAGDGLTSIPVTGYKLAADGLDLVMVDGKTLPAALQIVSAIVAGEISGAGTGTEVFVGLDGATTRATVTVDNDGNRSSVVYA